MRSKRKFNQRLLLPCITGLAVFLLPIESAPASLVYNFVNYPEFQNGWTLSGTISVDESALSDVYFDMALLTNSTRTEAARVG